MLRNAAPHTTLSLRADTLERGVTSVALGAALAAQMSPGVCM